MFVKENPDKKKKKKQTCLDVSLGTPPADLDYVVWSTIALIAQQYESIILDLVSI